MIYVDDLGQKMPSSLEAFQQSVLVPNESPDGAVLQALREHLTDMYKLYDSMQANFITLSAIDYINGCLLEEMPIIRNMPLSKAAHSWPYYLRAKTGISAAYAFMLFPKTSSYEMSVYIQAIEDMGFVMNFINDVLSYVFFLLLLLLINSQVIFGSLGSTRNFLPARQTTMSTIGHMLLGDRFQTLYKISLMIH